MSSSLSPSSRRRASVLAGFDDLDSPDAAPAVNDEDGNDAAGVFAFEEHTINDSDTASSSERALAPVDKGGDLFTFEDLDSNPPSPRPPLDGQRAREMTPAEFRVLVARGSFTKTTAGVCPGHVQANLVILPRAFAYDFLVFCQRNPRPCPVLEVTDPGQFTSTVMAPGADLRESLPAYEVYRHGKRDADAATTNITQLWDNYHREDVKEDDVTSHGSGGGGGGDELRILYGDNALVCFLLGCSFAFEGALTAAGLPLRHVEEGKTVPMYRTDRDCRPSGQFRGKLVVSMRPMSMQQVIEAVVVTSRYPTMHGAPIHIGDPSALGIADLSRPDYGEAVTIHVGEVPVFWACGVTPQSVVLDSGQVPLMITHAPGCMLVCDPLCDEWSQKQ